jgi:hypothetical protein
VLAHRAQARHRRDQEGDGDDGQRRADADLGEQLPGAGADEAQVDAVLVQRVQDQLDADEAQDDRQADRQVDQPVEQPLTRKYSCRRPIRANALAVKTRYGSW